MQLLMQTLSRKANQMIYLGHLKVANLPVLNYNRINKTLGNTGHM